MNVSNRVLDRLAKRFSLPSDYALSKFLHVTRAAVSSWRTEKSNMDEDIAIQACEALNEDNGPVLAELRAERAQSDEAATAWRRIADRLKKTAAVVTLGIAGILGLSHAPAVRAASETAQAVGIM